MTYSVSSSASATSPVLDYSFGTTSAVPNSSITNATTAATSTVTSIAQRSNSDEGFRSLVTIIIHVFNSCIACLQSVVNRLHEYLSTRDPRGGSDATYALNASELAHQWHRQFGSDTTAVTEPANRQPRADDISTNTSTVDARTWSYGSDTTTIDSSSRQNATMGSQSATADVFSTFFGRNQGSQWQNATTSSQTAAAFANTFAGSGTSTSSI